MSGNISMSLSRALDVIGLNARTVKARRESTLQIEAWDTLFLAYKKDRTSYYFGSQSEGTTTLGLMSDMDIMHCLLNYLVIRDITEWTPDKECLLMLHENTTPGYCRLQLLKRDKPEPETKITNAGLTYDNHGRVLLKSKNFCNERFGNYTININGPARTLNDRYFDIDLVIGIKCSDKIRIVDTWAKRRTCRQRGWPSQELIRQVVNEDAFVVPVGFKHSFTPEIEWRISASLAERRLMFSLNIEQIKCYALLKLLKKDIITPRTGEILTSYHCKTAVFYCMENTDTDFWREDNLLQCLIMCLKHLQRWVKIKFCPNYILEKANLFAGKVTALNKTKLLECLEYLIENIMDALIDLHTDSFGDVYKNIMATVQRPCKPILDSTLTKVVIAEIECKRHTSFAKITTYLLLDILSLVENLQFIIPFISDILQKLSQIAELWQRKYTENIINFTSHFRGSLMASWMLSRYSQPPQAAFDLLETEVTGNFSSRVKRASVLYCNGDLNKVELLLQELESHFDNNVMKPTCGCIHGHVSDINSTFREKLFDNIDERRRDGMFAHCIAFSRFEVYCAPRELRYELFRDAGDDKKNRCDTLDRWMDLAVVDSLPFMYFLQYITYTKLQKNDEQRQALCYLKLCIQEFDNNLGHQETAYNLLGQCHEIEQQFDDALLCYRISLDIRPRNNAANWLVPALIYKCIQLQGSDKKSF